MKQTAVEWYAVETGKLEVERAKGYLTFSQMFDKMLEILKQAKSMEKEQIIESVESTIKSIELTKDKTGFFAMGGEGYYNETFKSE